VRAAARALTHPATLALVAALSACDDPTTAPAPAERPSLTVVGTLNVTREDVGGQFGLHSSARGIAPSGQIVGEFSDDATGPRTGFRWEGGDGDALPALADVRRVQHVDVDFRTVGQTMTGKAFFYDGGATLTVLPERPFTPVSEAFASNSAGQIVGTASRVLSNTVDELPDAGDVALYWPCPTCAPQTIALQPSGNGRARDINEAGQVVGSVRNAQGQWRAFRWQNGVLTQLGTLGGTESHAEAINAAGHVVGWSMTASGAQHAFLWRDGVMTDLGTLGVAGTDWSRAYGINDNDEVVGTSEIQPTIYRAFLWRDGTMHHIDAGGGYYTSARDINNAGHIAGIVQQTAGGTRHATRWTITPLLPQAITFPLVGDHTLGDAPFTLQATAPGGPVTYSLNGPSVGCSLSGPNNATVTLTGITPALSACQILAHQGGNEVYLPANDVLRTFRIRYPFAFQAPIDAPGAGPTFTVNVMKAGNAVPVRFTLGGDHGLAVLNGAPVSQAFACGTMVQDKVEEQLPPNTPQGLTYQPGTGTYTYVWQTFPGYAGMCRKLTIKLADGREHTARFHFQ
jgi:probable HAF family extracellular repeat protein